MLQAAQRRRAGAAPGTEQQFPAVQERLEEQAGPLQPGGTTQGRSSSQKIPQPTQPTKAMEDVRSVHRLLTIQYLLIEAVFLFYDKSVI